MECIARGESYEHLPPCPYVDITGRNFHYVHRKTKTGQKVRLSKREELENKVSLLGALQKTDENEDVYSILIKVTRNNGFSLKAALRVFDPKPKVYKNSFNPTLKKVIEDSEHYEKFFQSEAYRNIKQLLKKNQTTRTRYQRLTKCK